MKLYTITRIPGGPLELRAQEQVFDRDAKNRPTGASHIETQIASQGYDTGNASKETTALALAIMRHYYGATDRDTAATAEAAHRAPRFMDAFLLHQKLAPGARLEISSDVLDRWIDLV